MRLLRDLAYYIAYARSLAKKEATTAHFETKYFFITNIFRPHIKLDNQLHKVKFQVRATKSRTYWLSVAIVFYAWVKAVKSIR